MTQSTTGLVEKLLLSADAGDYGRKPDPTDVRRQAADLLSTQETTIAELVAALEPFAAFAEELGYESEHDGLRVFYAPLDPLHTVLKVGDFRRAQTALTKSRSAL